MNPKVKKLREERAKNCAKIEKLTARNEEIDEAVMSLENADIVGIVRELGLTPDSLAELLATLKASPLPANSEKKEESYETEEI